jgi:hypothetical protein
MNHHFLCLSVTVMLDGAGEESRMEAQYFTEPDKFNLVGADDKSHESVLDIGRGRG